MLFTRFGTRCRNKTSGCYARSRSRRLWIGKPVESGAQTTRSDRPSFAGQTGCTVEPARSAAPRLGLEPRTYRLTAGRSTIELSGNKTGPILPHVRVRAAVNRVLISAATQPRFHHVPSFDRSELGNKSAQNPFSDRRGLAGAVSAGLVRVSTCATVS